MNETGLDALHDITKDVNDQDEKIWRRAASRKYLKKQIQKLEQSAKNYDIQINTLETGALYKDGESVEQFLKNELEQHALVQHLLQTTIYSKNSEAERKVRDIKEWDEKYKTSIHDFEEVYQQRKNIYESSNPTYRSLRQCEVAEKFANVKLKQVQAKKEAKLRSLKRLKEIQSQIVNSSVINFAKALVREKQNDELTSNLKEAEDEWKNMVSLRFQAQEELKKKKSFDNKRTYADTFSNLQQLQKRKESLVEATKNEESMVNSLKQADREKNISPEAASTNIVSESHEPTEKQIPLPSKKLKIISNKIVTLPPLDTILGRQRPRLDVSFRSNSADMSFDKSQNCQKNSQNDYSLPKNEMKEFNLNREIQLNNMPPPSQDMQNKLETMKKLSLDRKLQSNKMLPPQEIQNKSETMKSIKQVSNLSFTSTPQQMSSEYLKNLKLTTQNRMSTPLKSAEVAQNTQIRSQPFSFNRSQQVPSILRGQGVKRKMNSVSQNADMSPFCPKKFVNFASPIQECAPHSNDDNVKFLMESSMNVASSCDGEAGDMQGQNWGPGDFETNENEFSGYMSPMNMTNMENVSVTSMFQKTADPAPSGTPFKFGQQMSEPDLWSFSP